MYVIIVQSILAIFLKCSLDAKKLDIITIQRLTAA